MSVDPQATRVAEEPGPFLLPPGSVLKDRYEVEKELGRGAFGVVYLARDRQLLSKPVVIKALQQQTSADPWLLKKFQQEMESLARIDHPGVVGLLDVGETPEGRPYLVMQFVEGTTLRAAIGSKGMNLPRAANILRQVGHALSAAHEKGVCHRDLKPENIMLQSLAGGEEYAKLIDFGVAAVRDSQVAAAGLSSKIAGSLGYVAPEQLMGKPCPASDIYSLGVIAFEMLTGERPEVLAQGVTKSVRELRPEVPAAAEQAILSALSFYPDQRPQRPPDFTDQLAQSLANAGAVTQTARATQAAASAPTEHPSLEMAYVLFLDLVAYSTLTMDRQTQALQKLQNLVRSSGEFQRAQAAGQLISLPTGDGMALVFFQNPVSAVQCALDLARAARQDPSIQLRTGVHTGPVYRIADINANLNVAGGGINLAQRVMDCGDAGHILVSKSVGDVLSQLSDWTNCLHDLGEHEVKHGVKVHLLNLYTEDAGNPEIPSKLRRDAMPQPIPLPPPKSHRGLYMLAGSLLTIAILIFAGTQIAEWRKTQAGARSRPVAPAGISGPVEPAPATIPPAPAGVSGAAEPAPVIPPAPAPVTPPPSVNQPPSAQRQEGRPPHQKATAPVQPPRQPAPAAPAPAAEPQKAQPAQAPQAPAIRDPAAPAPRAVLEELRERMILLAARAGAVRNSLQNLERQQAQSGFGLRSDIKAASERMEYRMSDASAALKAGDPVALGRDLDLVERDIEKLEGFLGR